MKRSVSLDRLYSLGDYKNIHFLDTIDDVPEELSLNPEFMMKLRLVQLYATEIAYRRYLDLVTKHPHTMNIEEAIKSIETLHEAELKSLHDIMLELSQKLNGKKLKEPKLPKADPDLVKYVP